MHRPSTTRPLPRLATLLLAALASCGGSAGPSLDPARPNVVLVTLDTTRADFFGSYGHPDGPTPHFDALAADGVLFENGMSVASVTPVSHATILTGQYPQRHGVRVMFAEGGYRLKEEAPSLAEQLRARGYRTIAAHSAFPVSSHFGFERGFDEFHELYDDGTIKNERGWDVHGDQRRSDETMDLVLARLEQVEGPFFLWLHLWDPHDVHRMPPDEFLADYPAPPDGQWKKEDRGRYAIEVRYTDQQFGRLTAFLKDAGAYDNTVFAVTSDHGEGLGEHDWITHRLLYQEQIHVPLILRIPGEASGKRVGDLVRTADIAPTLAEALGLDFSTADGASLLGLMRGQPDAAPRTVYAEQLNGYDKNAGMLRHRPNDDFLYCLIEGDWKLIYHPAHPDVSQLYHLGDDPDEAHNLWERERDVRRRMLLELTRRNPWVTRQFPPDEHFDPDAVEDLGNRMSALGYGQGAEDGEPLDVESDKRWIWTCVDHGEVQAEQKGQCEHCGELLILSARPKQRRRDG